MSSPLNNEKGVPPKSRDNIKQFRRFTAVKGMYLKNSEV